LKELPSSIGQLNALQKLHLCSCKKLEKLPSSIGQLNALQELDLGACSNLKELPSFRENIDMTFRWIYIIDSP
jgi:Leucine-rich repeat (LRR) protein